MKFPCILFLFSFFGYISYSQIRLEGTVQDHGGNPLEFAYVSLFADSTDSPGTFTDSMGKFQFPELSAGYYKLGITYLGEHFKNYEIDLAKDTLLQILADSAGNQLGGIVVSATKPLVERKIDRIVFNVENSVAANTGDALDALKVTPGVKVQNDLISLIGKSGLSIMVNDRPLPLSGPDLANYLKSISGDNIKSIEVITSPPSKYQAQGNSGIINIILKKNLQALWRDNIRASYIQTTYPAMTLGNTFIYNKDKIRFQISADGKVGNQQVLEDYEIYYPGQYSHQITKRKDRQDYLSGYSSIDYDLSQQTSFGIQYIGSLKRPDKTNTYHADLIDAASGIQSGIDSKGESIIKNNFHSLNLHFIQKLDSSGKKMTFDVDYFTYCENNNRDFSNQNIQPDGQLTDFFSANNQSRQKMNNYSAKVDFDYPTKMATFTYGARASFSNTDNNVSFFNTTTGEPVIDLSQTDQFRYSENTLAIYADVEKEINKNWQVKFGLRFENTETKGLSLAYNETNRYNYAKVFPTFYLLHVLNTDNSLSLTYSRRLNRPAFWELNPFRWYINAFAYAVGNPFLQPEFVHNIDLTHTFKSKLVSTLSFSVTQNGFSQFPSVDSNTFQQVFSRANYFTLYNYGFSESYNFNKWIWWENNNQLSLNYVRSSFFNKNVQTTPLNGLGLTFSTSNTFVITKDKTFSCFLNFWYSSANKALLYESSESYALDIGVRKLLLHKKLQCVLMVSDIFKSSIPISTTYTNGIKQAYYIYPDSRYLRMVVRYSIGSEKISNKVRGTGNQEEVGRSGQ